MVSLVPFEISALVRLPERRRRWVVCASLPLLLDALLPLAGFWANNAASRFATGLLFGVMLSTLLSPALAELLQDFSWPRCRRGMDGLGGPS